MEEDDEIHSHASPESDSSSRPSGRITVTVAAAAPSTSTPPPSPPHHNSLTLALPIQQPSSRPPPSSGGGGREDCWSEGATSVLIDAWGERYMELSRGNLKQKHWKEVADIVSSRENYTKPPKTDIQCKNRIDTVKKKYKIEKAKVAAGADPSRWPFFDRLDRLIGSSSSSASASATKVAVSTSGKSQKAVPVGIPVGVRPLPLPHFSTHLHPPPHLQTQQIRHHNFPSPVIPRFNTNNSSRQQPPEQQLRRGPPESESEAEEGWSPDSTDSFPPERKRAKVEVSNSGAGGRVKKGKRKRDEKEMRVWGKSVRELTRAILKFGEAYEAAESAKLQQIMEIEKQRMKFAKELELQRMKFLMKTQLELSQLNGNGNNHNNNSDSRGGGSSGRRGGCGGGGGGGGEINHHHENHLNHHANSDSSN